MTRTSASAIAITGMACRFPGNANTPDELWRNLQAGVNGVTEIPPSRFDVQRFYNQSPAVPGKTSTQWGGFIEGFDAFDHSFFGISPKEAASMDPQQRWLLEVAWEALEDAGYSADELKGTDTGVFVGLCNNDYAQLFRPLEDPTSMDAYFGTGNASSFAAGRLSYALGLQGPSVVVDTACSSSLVAVHLACRALLSGECETALAGGANALLTPTGFIYVSQLRAVASDGRCKPFSAGADGYVRAEGCGVIVLRRLEDALRDGSRVLAVILGSAINHDGRSSTLTAPNRHAQVKLVQTALRNAGVPPETIAYVEAHGTGTALGDPIEASALSEALCRERPEDHPLFIGSVKADLGHLEAAAGIAGLIKTVCCLRAASLPPQRNLAEPSPHLAGLRIAVSREMLPWTRNGFPRRAAVSSFGFSGTNAHVVLEEHAQESGSLPANRPLLLAISAKSAESLKRLAHAYDQMLDRAASGGQLDAALRICAAAATKRAHHRYRLAVWGDQLADLKERLAAWREGRAGAGFASGSETCRIAFVYAGQGGQWDGMGRQLWLSMPLFRESLLRCGDAIRRAEGPDVVSAILSAPVAPPIDGADIEITQSAIWAVQCALTDLWRSWGIEPDAVVGHSMGEAAAAWACGALSLDDSARIIVERARLLRGAARTGDMLAVECDSSELSRLLRDHSGVAVAVRNAPRWFVLAGTSGAIEALKPELDRRGLEFRPIRTSGVPGHSPQVRPFVLPLVNRLAGIATHPLRVPMVSTVTGEKLASAQLNQHYWGRNMAEPVDFRAAANLLIEDGYTVFLEISPHPILTSAVAACADGHGSVVTTLASLRRNESELASMMSSLGDLYAHGRPIRWTAVYDRAPWTELPLYCWDHKRSWISSPQIRAIPCEPVLIGEDELREDCELTRHFRKLSEDYAVEGAAAINRRQMAPNIFFPRSRQAFFYCARAEKSVTALLFAGPESEYQATVSDLLNYAATTGLACHVMAEEHRLSAIASMSLSSTPIGILQFIPDLAAFTIEGTSMRRLRYLVQRFASEGRCETRECDLTSTADSSAVLQLMEQWIERKGVRPSFADDLAHRLRSGSLDQGARVFMTWRDAQPVAAILLSPVQSRNGYLMDLEFYGSAAPAGSLEFTIVNVIEQLRAGGHSYFSLGGAYGTEISPHPDADPHIADTLAELYRSGVLNGDANAQFKRKFRPTQERLFVCAPKHAGSSCVDDILRMLSGKTHVYESAALSAIRLDLAGEISIYETQLSAEHLRELQHHRIDSKAVLPGSAYLEILSRVFGEQCDQWTIEDFVIERPIFLNGDANTVIQLVLDADSAGGRLFRFCKRETDRGVWQTHATGIARKIRSAPSSSRVDFSTSCAALTPADLSTFYSSTDKAGVQYGAAFQRIEALWTGSGEAIGRIRAVGPSGLQASIVDAALQVLLAASTLGGGPAAGWLQSIGRITSYEPLRRGCWSHARIRTLDGGRLVGDVQLYNESGALAVQFEEITAAGFHGNSERLSSSLFSIGWEPISVSESPRISGEWLVLGGPSRTAHALSAGLSRAGARVRSERTGADAAGTVYVAPAEADLESCMDGSIRGQALSIIQSLIRSDLRPPRLWIVTQGAQAAGDNVLHPAQALLWGLGRVFGMEHPSQFGGLIDIGEQADASLLASILAGGASDNREFAIRESKVYVPRLKRAPAPANTRPKIGEQGSYLIAGGLKGLGLEAGKWLVGEGARHLCLISRRGVPDDERAHRTLAELRRRGVQVLLMAADIGNAADVQTVVDQMRNSMPALRGVIHSAGVVADGALATLHPTTFESALHPKLRGAWNLHLATLNASLDFFVLFSSAAALLGPRGQAPHAAACSFLDAFAWWRRAQGLPATSIDWGAWSGAGAADQPELLSRLSFQGIEPIDAGFGSQLLGAAMGRSEPQLLAMPVNWARWACSVPYRTAALWSNLANPQPADVTTCEIRRISDRLRSAPSRDDRREIATAFIRDRAGAALGMTATAIEPARSLLAYGLDSLMSISLRNAIEAEFKIRIPIAHFLQGASVEELAGLLVERLLDGPLGVIKKSA